MKWKMPIWESKQKSRTFHFFGGSFQVESDSEQDFFSNDLSDVLSTRINWFIRGEIEVVIFALLCV
jgi:hypothetical protein